ncbi:stage III sporulation protein AG [Clostridium chrysemydis]|uniref:stage III sporulation protein AG n=1 Tax=Clostridium chrysemydis TaxID=2665504 RepID=UPI00308339EA
MDFSKLKGELKSVFKQKNFTMILVISLILIFILISISFFSPKKEELTSKKDNSSDNLINEVNIKDQYEKEQNEKLTSILKEMKGVGEVSVMMTFEGGEEKIPAYNSDVQKSTTEETDKEGGKRKTNQENGGENIVMSTENGENKPFVTQTIKPKVISVIVIAEGASISKIKYNIEKAVSDLYNIPLNKVNVYPKSN